MQHQTSAHLQGSQEKGLWSCQSHGRKTRSNLILPQKLSLLPAGSITAYNSNSLKTFLMGRKCERKIRIANYVLTNMLEKRNRLPDGAEGFIFQSIVINVKCSTTQVHTEKISKGAHFGGKQVFILIFWKVIKPLLSRKWCRKWCYLLT